MKTTVLSLGGSLIVPMDIDIEFLREFRKLILEFAKKGERFIIICGGGKTCRTYQNAANAITDISDIDGDLIGIASTRLNAEMIRALFSEYAYECVYEDPTIKVETEKPIIIGAGWLPGHSTDMDAVELAEIFGAKQVINMSNIEKVYDKDPKDNPDAMPIDKISWDDFLNIIGEEWVPGKNVPFDPVASKKAKNIGLKAIILNGNLDNLRRCLQGEEFVGTVIG